MHKLLHTLGKKRIILVTVLLLFAVFIVLVVTGVVSLTGKKETPETIPSKKLGTESSKPKTEPSSSDEESSQQTPKPTEKNPSPSTSPEDSRTLLKPSGSFISNHTPGKNGSPTLINSVCTSTPGATCYIELKNTKTGEVTKLAKQVLESDGSASWEWDSNVLTSGKWQVTAIATLGSKTESTVYPLILEIE